MEKTSTLYTCPCCGYFSFTEPPGSFEICDICGWEDDPVQLANPCTNGGANTYSLHSYQTGFLNYPRAEIKSIEEEGNTKDPNWRPLNNVEIDIYNKESENGTKFVNKGISKLKDAYWNRNIVREKT